MQVIIARFLSVAAVAALAVASFSAANAETVKVPFAFHAQGKAFPAGTYRVTQTVGRNFVTLQSLDGATSFTSVIGSGQPSPEDGRVILRFDADRSNHELRSIQYHNQISARLDRGSATAERQPGE